jgi:4-diphosphocytidyl-2-C-methyl-D-erythritol kinase
VRAPAKVNLTLELLGKRPDGYHEIRTVMQAVDLQDELRLSLREDGEVHLECDAEGVPSGEENLVVRAARLMQDELGESRGVDLRLEKRIPAGAGLGGGSSDCAATLRALNALWGGGLAEEKLKELAGRLGSDVAFFIRGGAALCTGRGEKVQQVDVRRPVHYAIIMPGFHVSTPRVYGQVASPLTTAENALKNVLRGLSEGNCRLIGGSLFNALERPACEVDSRLAEVRKELAKLPEEKQGSGFLLSGSGSSFFSIYPGRREARAAACYIKDNLGLRCAPIESLPEWGATV